MFTLICARINGWVNNREAGDLRRYRAHYDVIVMESLDHYESNVLQPLQCRHGCNYLSIMDVMDVITYPCRDSCFSMIARRTYGHKDHHFAQNIFENNCWCSISQWIHIGSGNVLTPKRWHDLIDHIYSRHFWQCTVMIVKTIIKTHAWVKRIQHNKVLLKYIHVHN